MTRHAPAERRRVPHGTPGLTFHAVTMPALLAGRKTQTRRRLSPRHALVDGRYDRRHDLQRCSLTAYTTLREDGSMVVSLAIGRTVVLTPRWRIGQRVYVREAVASTGSGAGYLYQADDVVLPPDRRWLPACKMPADAARLMLHVRRAWFERLQDISEADAQAEGFADRLAFADAWSVIHGPGAWDANPWIVAIEFDVERLT